MDILKAMTAPPKTRRAYVLLLELCVYLFMVAVLTTYLSHTIINNKVSGSYPLSQFFNDVSRSILNPPTTCGPGDVQ